MSFSDVSAESLLLTCFVKQPDSFIQLSEYLTEDDFTETSYQYIFRILSSLFLNKEVTKLNKSKIISEARALQIEDFSLVTQNGILLDKIFDQEVSNVEVKDYFTKVKRNTIRRHYDTSLREAVNYNRQTIDGITDLVSHIESLVIKPIFDIEKDKHSPIQICQSARSIIEDLAEDPGFLGLDLGYPEWQSRIGQVRNGSVTFLVSSTGSGKSQYGLRLAITAAHKYNYPVLLLDSELNQVDQTIRLVGCFAGVPYNIIESGYWKLSEEELRSEGLSSDQINNILEYKRRLTDDLLWEKVSRMKITYISISGLGVEEVIPRMRRWVLTEARPNKEAKFPECFIVYDYIKLSHRDELRSGKMQEWQLHGLNMAALHDFATEYNLPIITFGQTNRELDDGLNCVAGSRRITENADSVTLIKNKTLEESQVDGVGNMYFKIFKARYGQGTRIGHINFQSSLDRGEFKELGYSKIDLPTEVRKMNQRKYTRDQDDE